MSDNKKEMTSQSMIDKSNSSDQQDRSIKNNFYLPLIITISSILLTNVIWMFQNHIIRKDIKLDAKIKIVADLSDEYSQYYYYSSIRSMIHMEKMEYVQFFAAETQSDFHSIELGIRERMQLQDTLRKMYTTEYDKMLEGDTKVHGLSKNLILAKLFFSESVGLKIDSLYDYMPIDNALDRKIKEGNFQGRTNISEPEKNKILTTTLSEMNELFTRLLTKMYNEL